MSELEDDDVELDELVREIFNIIPSYYDEGEARAIKRLIHGYVSRKLPVTYTGINPAFHASMYLTDRALFGKACADYVADQLGLEVDDLRQ